jgi:hypothetical protein
VLKMSISTVVLPYHVQVYTHGCNYTCPVKQLNGEWLFKFKNEWHRVEDYIDEFTRFNKSMMS